MRRRLLASGVALLAIAGIGFVPGTAAAGARSSTTTAAGVTPEIVVGPMVSHARSQPPTSAQCAAATGGAVQACYGPPDIQAQYDFGPLYLAGDTGAGQTIVIFDAFGSPTIASDLQSFDLAYGLPDPPSLNVYMPEGKVNYSYAHVASPVDFHNKNVQTEIGWAYETTLDVEWAHALAPGAAIALVVTPIPETQGVQGIPNLQNAQKWALQNHIGTIWSNSWATTEQAFHTSATLRTLNGLYATAAAQGVSAFFATGDAGVANGNKLRPPVSVPDSHLPFGEPGRDCRRRDGDREPAADDQLVPARGGLERLLRLGRWRIQHGLLRTG